MKNRHPCMRCDHMSCPHATPEECADGEVARLIRELAEAHNILSVVRGAVASLAARIEDLEAKVAASSVPARPQPLHDQPRAVDLALGHVDVLDVP